MRWQRQRGRRSSGREDDDEGNGRPMELSSTLPLPVTARDNISLTTSDGELSSTLKYKSTRLRNLMIPASWRVASTKTESEATTCDSMMGQIHSQPDASPWSLSEANLRIQTTKTTTKERSKRSKKRRSSYESSDQGGIKCLVVDNDFTPFTTADEEFEWTNSEKSDLGGPDDDGSASRPQSHHSERSVVPSTPYWMRYLWDTIWPAIKSFVLMTFPDKHQERVFQREQWHATKPGAFAGVVFILLSTLLSIASVKKWALWYYYAYIGIIGGFTFPLPFLIMFNVYYKAYWLYQFFLVGAAWCWGFILTVEMNQCGFFRQTPVCQGKTYLNLMALLAGIPTFALIAMKQNRAVHLIGVTSWMVFMLVYFLPDPETKGNMGLWRNVILCTIYHYMFSGVQERSDRQLFILRTQLKAQYRAVQSAQEMERQAEHSKRRFVSYIFHEVRVPLNTARLALANLDAEGAFANTRHDQRDLLIGLDGSLRMMEKVLNDVLSFNRMESGNLVLSRKPFNFHQAMQHVALAYRPTAETTGLTFSLETDPRIDAIGGFVIGDDMRFKQVCSNLVSNAFKFTQTGGVKIVSKLLYPDLPEVVFEANEEEKEKLLPPESGSMRSHRPVPPPRAKVRVVDKVYASVNFSKNTPMSAISATPTPMPTAPNLQDRTTKAVIRVEIHDTGVGLSLSDVRDNRLFSPYVQTEIGRRQGGKGSGLGLALVTQIVKLCKGRLGVDSEAKKGSVFWFELPYNLPTNDEDLPPVAVPTESPGILRSHTTLPPLFDDRDPALPISSRPGMSSPYPENHSGSGGYMALPTQQPESTSPSPAPPSPSPHPSLHPFPQPSPHPSPHPSPQPSPLPSHRPSPSPRRSHDPQRHEPALMAPRPLPSSVLPASPPLTSAEHASLSTLVVDDDPLTRRLMSRMLSRLGHAVQMAEDGRQALDILQRSFDMGPPIDVVFLDNQMPHMSGVEVARALRAIPSDIYIVGCTGNALKEDQEEYLAAGADVIVTKPIHQSAIIQKLALARDRAWMRSMA